MSVVIEVISTLGLSVESYDNHYLLIIYFTVLQKRHILEENNQIEARVSAVEEDLEDMETSDEEEAVVWH